MAILLLLHAVASCPFKVMEFYFIIKLRIPCIQIPKFMHISKLNTFFNAIKTNFFFKLIFANKMWAYIKSSNSFSY